MAVILKTFHFTLFRTRSNLLSSCNELKILSDKKFTALPRAMQQRIILIVLNISRILPDGGIFCEFSKLLLTICLTENLLLSEAQYNKLFLSCLNSSYNYGS